MDQKVKKPLIITIKVLSYILIAGIVIVFLLSKLSGSPLFLFGKTTMWVITDSMDPTIPERTYILIEKVDVADIKEGDIISFYSTDPKIKGQINTHRVESINGDIFITKGDNNPTNDGAYSAKAENIVGRYVKTLPIMTFLGRIIMTEAGFAIVIILFIVLVAVCYIPEIKNALKKNSRDDDPSAELDEETKKEIEKRVQEELQKRKDENA